MRTATALNVVFSRAQQRPLEPDATTSELPALAAKLADRTASIAVVGLGYVGVPLLVAAGQEGFPVIGLDVDARKVRSMREHRSYVADVTDDDLAGLARAHYT